MRIPVVQGTIERRILVNYRVDPEVVARLLPPPFCPRIIDGAAIAGVCLIRLRGLRPMWLPGSWGMTSENAAHRIAVEWDECGRRCEGVFIPRRDTDSRWNTLVGGRLFPGVHHHARFRVDDQDDRLSISVESDDGNTQLSLMVRPSIDLPAGSVFGSLPIASSFFERGALGYSPARREGEYDGLELRCRRWQMEPLEVADCASSYFDDPRRFPPGTAHFDCALMMRQIDHQWHSHGMLRCNGGEVISEPTTVS